MEGVWLCMDNPEKSDSLTTWDRSADLPDLVRFAAASEDFNPIHYDNDAARAAGLDGLILPGLLKAGWLADLAVHSVPGEWDLVEFDVSYRGLDFVGDGISVGGSRSPASDDETIFELWGKNPSGAQTTVGRARFRRSGSQ